MGPFRKVVVVARHERTKTAVRAGGQVFGTVRNLAAIGAALATLATGGFFAARNADEPAPAAPRTALEQLKGPLAYEVPFA
ncbi:MAG: hypothetical protein FJ034_06745, partial [Chloroflexi bacterium]|nr:hypothetical protein [Chloroflexota bacterium]